MLSTQIAQSRFELMSCCFTTCFTVHIKHWLCIRCRVHSLQLVNVAQQSPNRLQTTAQWSLLLLQSLPVKLVIVLPRVVHSGTAKHVRMLYRCLAWLGVNLDASMQ